MSAVGHGIQRPEVVDATRSDYGRRVSAYIHVPVDALRIALFDAEDATVRFAGAIDENGDEWPLPSGVVSDLAMQARDAWEAFIAGEPDEDDDACECDCGGRDKWCPCTPRGLGREL